MADDDTPTETVKEPPETPAVETLVEDPENPVDPMMERVEGISKGLQKVTQEIAQLGRKLDKDGELSRVDRAKLEQAAENAAKLKKGLKQYTETGETGDDETIDKKAANGLLTVLERLDAVEAENKSLRQQVSKPSPEETWAEEKAKYPGVDVKKLWKESWDAALATETGQEVSTMLENGEITQARADKLLLGSVKVIYHERASKPQGKKLPVATPAPSKPPLGARSAHMPGVKPVASAAGNDPVAQAALERLSY